MNKNYNDLKEYFKDKFKGATITSITPLVVEDDRYLSNRESNDIYLVCNKPNRVTVEDYCKWYNFFYPTYNPDNESEMILIALSYGDIIEGYNNSFYPDSIVRFCKENNLKIDAISYINIVKMYYEEYDNDDIISFINHLPHSDSLAKVIDYDRNINSEYFKLNGEIDGHLASYYTLNNKVWLTKLRINGYILQGKTIYFDKNGKRI